MTIVIIFLLLVFGLFAFAYWGWPRVAMWARVKSSRSTMKQFKSYRDEKNGRRR